MDTQVKRPFKDLPVFGVGLGLRRPLLTETLAATDLINWVEIVPENYMGRGGAMAQMLDQAFSVYPIITHGVSLSIGSNDPISPEYIQELKALFAIIDPPWFSDHLCYSGIEGSYFNDLIPLVRTQAVVSHVSDRIKQLQDEFQRTFLIENISFYLDYPENEMPEHEFIARITEASDCGILLDVNNVYVNYLNHGLNTPNSEWEPKHVMSNMPLERVVQMHIAGHDRFPEGIIDTHGNDVCEDVWTLLDWVLERTVPCGVLLERDNNIPAFSELEKELRRIQAPWKRTQELESLPPAILKTPKKNNTLLKAAVS